MKRIGWMFFVACALLAIWKVIPHNGAGMYDAAAGHTDDVANWSTAVKDAVDNALNGADDDGPRPDKALSPSHPGEADAALDGLPVDNNGSTGYSRSQWQHWDNVTTCWTVREEVLYRDASKGSLTMRDASGVPTSNKAKACTITGGTWKDPYTGSTFTNPEDLDIDHLVPLGYAARHGGNSWDSDRKRDYANSLDAGHLLAVSASANRSKSDKGPSIWKPTNTATWCGYATAWVGVSSKWGLSTTAADKKALTEMLSKCSR